MNVCFYDATKKGHYLSSFTDMYSILFKILQMNVDDKGIIYVTTLIFNS
jgi:hypothetical protein